jgi:hypothetical protein
MGGVMDKYILIGRDVKRCDDIHEWGKWFQNADRHIGEDLFSDGARVSTVFLGLDHRSLDDGPPVLFETMIFGGPHNEWQDRYCTYDEAEAGHKRVCDALSEGREP